MRCLDIECAVAEYFNPRVNLAIPNVSWGFLRYEADLLILTKSARLYEVEIKVSKSDLKRDLKKTHNHDDRRINKVFFAIPKELLKHADMIPDYAGILVVSGNWCCRKERDAPKRNDYKLSDEEVSQLYRLGALKVWTAKRKFKEHLDRIKGEQKNESHTRRQEVSKSLD